MKNVRKHRHQTPIKWQKKRSSLVEQAVYDAIKWFSEKLLAVPNKIEVKMSLGKVFRSVNTNCERKNHV